MPNFGKKSDLVTNRVVTSKSEFTRERKLSCNSQGVPNESISHESKEFSERSTDQNKIDDPDEN